MQLGAWLEDLGNTNLAQAMYFVPMRMINPAVSHTWWCTACLHEESAVNTDCHAHMIATPSRHFYVASGFTYLMQVANRDTPEHRPIFHRMPSLHRLIVRCSETRDLYHVSAYSCFCIYVKIIDRHPETNFATILAECFASRRLLVSACQGWLLVSRALRAQHLAQGAIRVL